MIMSLLSKRQSGQSGRDPESTKNQLQPRPRRTKWLLGGLIALGLLLVLELSLRLQGGLEEFANPPSPVGYPGIPGYGELVEPGWRACFFAC